MNYTDEEIERAKAIFAREGHSGKPRQMAVAVMAGLSRPGHLASVTHERTWRDLAPQARRELINERRQ